MSDLQMDHQSGPLDLQMDHRSVPLEVLREFARSQMELTSIRLMAEDAGVGRSTLHKFVTTGSTPHPRVRRLLALWYMRRLDGLDEMEVVRPFVSALRILLRDVPERSVEDIRERVLDSIEQGCTATGSEAPRWVGVLRARLKRAGPRL